MPTGALFKSCQRKIGRFRGRGARDEKKRQIVGKNSETIQRSWQRKILEIWNREWASLKKKSRIKETAMEAKGGM